MGFGEAGMGMDPDTYKTVEGEGNFVEKQASGNAVEGTNRPGLPLTREIQARQEQNIGEITEAVKDIDQRMEDKEESDGHLEEERREDKKTSEERIEQLEEQIKEMKG